uniref:PUA domain-containing protein n=1 Tax=uncultured marine thaumarchaeote KM3_70_D07 TaxID=1456252 RepID=A0A075HG54_9ARCH|nr:PUA domain-containing protein [uncultured marine thaumarchaeote KM3_70_D07]
MKTNLISKSETSTILKEISLKWRQDMPKIKNLMSHYVDAESQILIGDNLKLLKINDEYIPFLSETKLLESFPNVVVDMGAVKFMCNGANVMRPGIKNYSDFLKDDIVCVVEESQHKFLAVGKALVNSSEMKEMPKGEVIKNLHYISDKYWEVSKIL